jgi:type VI secretion system protein ImpE
MTAQELFQAGKLTEAIRALGAAVRDDPTDARRRTFLFELLCFAGEFDRAGKHLNVLAQGSPDTEVGALVYRSALAAESARQGLFEKGEAPPAPSESPSGTLNGKPFRSIEDADPRIGARLEVFVAGEYLLMPFSSIGSLRMEAPRRLRDLMWSTALVTASASYRGKDLGEVLLPVLCPLSWKHPSDAVKLGRATEWGEAGETAGLPYGQKMLVLDGEEAVPILEVRELVFATEAAASAA